MSAPTGDAELNESGCTNKLRRTLGSFHTFAAGVSYISVLTGTFQLSYLGISHGGPAYWWSWPMVFLGQLMVALSFAELAARYPVAGSVYNWSKKLGNNHVAWLAGWMMLLASIVSISATVLAYQKTLPQIWSAFQVIGDGSDPADNAANGVLLASALIVVNIGQSQIFSAVTSLAIILIYISYLLVTVPMLIARLRGEWAPGKAEGRFSLGRFGLPVNILAVLWGLGTTSNLAWPRRAIYNATPPYHWYLQYSAILFVGIVVVGGFAYYWFAQRHRIGVLADHAAPAADRAPESAAEEPAEAAVASSHESQN